MRQTFGKWMAVAALAASVAACGGGSGGDGGTTGAAPVTSGSATLGAGGGTVATAAGATVVVPAGALAADTTIRVAQDSSGAPELPAGLRAAGAVHAITPHGTTFAQPATVRLPRPAITLAANEVLMLAKAESATDSVWQILADTTERDGMLQTQVSSFSYFVAVVVTYPVAVVDVRPVRIDRIDVIDCGGQDCNDLVGPATLHVRVVISGNQAPGTCPNPGSGWQLPFLNGEMARSVDTDGSLLITVERDHWFGPTANPLVIVARIWCNGAGPHTPDISVMTKQAGRWRAPAYPSLIALPLPATTQAVEGLTTPLRAILMGGAVRISGISVVKTPSPEDGAVVEWQRSDDQGASWRTVAQSFQHEADPRPYPTNLTNAFWSYWGVSHGLNASTADAGARFRVRACYSPPDAPAPPCVFSTPTTVVVVQSSAVPAFTTAPQSVLVRSGQTASFSAAASGTPAPTLQWQTRAANSSGAWADVPGATGSTYTTAVLGLADNGLQLRVVASNAVGRAESAGVTVSVSDLDIAPTITTQPATIAVAAGGDAVFAIAARGTEALSYQWRFNGNAIVGANSAVLKLAAVSNANAGRYSVVVSNAAGSATSTDATLDVTAGAGAAVAPTIVTPPAAVTVNEGNTATFAVGVGGSTPLSYQWLKEGQPIEGATAAYYSLAAATTGSAGSYAVRVSNAAGSVTSAAASLTVHAVAAPVAVSISTQPSPQVQLPGGSATFAVAASGSGPLQYQWLKDGSAISGATAAVLNLGNLTAADVGSYSVTVGNALGSVNSSAAVLTVVGAPAVITQPAASSVAAGATASFSVTASGQGLRYQWLRNGLPIGSATDASYTTPALTVADSGAVYSVAVYNGAGLVFSQGALLTVTSSAASASAYGKLSAFYGHVCAVTASGHVYCWGKGDSGQLGDGRSADTSTPVRAAGIANAEFVVAGYTATCAIHDGGKLSCWGDKLDDTGSAATPVFKGISDATWAAVGFYHVCYVNTHGEIWCWGSNTYGALGDGTRTSRSSPVQVKWADGTALTGAVSVAASSYSTCATLASGQVWCWGKDVSDAARTAPARVRRLNFDGQRLELTTQGHAVAGIDHFCANDANPTSARPVCWGFNNGGQLGDFWVPSVMSTPNSPHDDATPTGQNEVGEQQLAGGGDHSCSLNYPAGDGTNLRCWGRTYFGNGADTEVLGPTAAAGLANYNLHFGAPIHAVAAGPRFTCALRSGAVLCWGDNAFGQIGNGSTVAAQTLPTVTSLGAVFWQP